MTKFLYVLVSEEKDIYYEQTLASVLSLRHYNPDAFISLLVDDKTDKNLVGFRGEIKKLVNEYKAIPYDDNLSNQVRSRYLKTNMRNLVDGDFLFIDGDTAVVDKLEPNFSNGNESIYAVTDLHSVENDKYHLKHKKMRANKEKMNFSLSFGDKYFNSGVIFARDNDAARNFFSKWHSLYKQCAEKGIFTDQLSFNEVNKLLNQPIKELPGQWNCQIREAYNHLYRVKTIYPILCHSKIIHFFSTGIDGRKEPHPLMKKDFFLKIKEQQNIDDSSLEVIQSAKSFFWGAPKTLDEKKSFPLFFLYRQFPNLCRLMNRLGII